MKTQKKMWAIVYRDWGLYLYSIKPTRKEAIWGHCDHMQTNWKECRKAGDRAVKVLVTILEEPK